MNLWALFGAAAAAFLVAAVDWLKQRQSSQAGAAGEAGKVSAAAAAAQAAIAAAVVAAPDTQAEVVDRLKAGTF